MLDKQTNSNEFELSWIISEIDIYKIEELLLNNEINDITKLEKSLINMLNKWLNIQNQRMYVSVTNILNNLDMIKLCKFSDIKAINWYSLFTMWYEFSMKLEEGYMKIFPSTMFTWFWIFNPTQLWYIYDGKFHSKLDNSIWDNINNNNQFSFSNEGNQELLNSQNQELIRINEELRREQDVLLTQREQGRIQIQVLQNQIDSQVSISNLENISTQCDNLDTDTVSVVENETDPVLIEDDIVIQDNTDIQNQEDIMPQSDNLDAVVSVDNLYTASIEVSEGNIVSQDSSDTDGGSTDNNEWVPELNKPESYTVESWDTLWKIVKEKYGLTSNRDIANCINKLVKYNVDNEDKRDIEDDNTPDGIFWDKIYVWQKILLANELIFRKQIFKRKKT